jgi:type II secretory pathway component PulF
MSAIAAVFVILLFIVPSIAPMAAELGAAPPVLSIMMAASEFLRGIVSAKRPVAQTAWRC